MPPSDEEFSAARAIAWQKVEAGWSGSTADLRSLESRFTSTYPVLHDHFFDVYGGRDDCDAQFAQLLSLIADSGYAGVALTLDHQHFDPFADDFGVDVASIPGGGAAGGLGGALAALGGTLLPGFELVADELDLYDHLEGADLVITGEGCLDDTSSHGKVVGGIASFAAEQGIDVLAIVGSDERADRSNPAGLDVISLVADYGEDEAFAEPKRLIEQAAAMWLAARR